MSTNARTVSSSILVLLLTAASIGPAVGRPVGDTVERNRLTMTESSVTETAAATVLDVSVETAEIVDPTAGIPIRPVGLNYGGPR
jgi:hypothetical protein